MFAGDPKRFPLSCLYAFLVLLAIPSLAPAQVHLWSRHIGDSGRERATDLALGPSGNLILVGEFEDAIDLGGGPLNSAGADDVFLAKLDPFGNHIWSQRFGSTGTDLLAGVATDPSGNIVITGHFQGTVDFGGDPLTGLGEYDVFLAKYDLAGNHLWSKRYGGLVGEGVGGVSVDSSGRVVITGHFSGTADFGGGLFTSAGAQDIFIAGYDADGNHIWSRQFGSGSSDWGSSVAAYPAGDIVTTGLFHGNLSFGGPPLNNYGEGDSYLVKFDSAGNHLWSRNFDPPWSDDVTIDASGNVLITGTAGRTADFGGLPLTCSGGRNVFLAKFDAAGNHIWSQCFGDSLHWWAFHPLVAADAATVTLSGGFAGTWDFGGGPITSAGFEDIFLAIYDTSGNHVWSRQFGDSLIDNDIAAGLALDPHGNVVLAGTFLGVVDFGDGPLTSIGYDVFLAEYTRVPTAVIKPITTAPTTFFNYPNPFNPSTTIQFVLPHETTVNLTVFDAQGRRVLTLLDEKRFAGINRITWNGKDATGAAVSAGLYFCRLTTDNHEYTRKILLLK